LFPGVEIPEHDYGKLQEEIEAVILHRKLQVVPAQVLKVIQLYETMLVRHGVMLVGPTGSGKTTCYQVSELFISVICGPIPTDPVLHFSALLFTWRSYDRDICTLEFSHYHSIDKLLDSLPWLSSSSC